MGVDLTIFDFFNRALSSAWLDPVMWSLTTVALPLLLLVPGLLAWRGHRREALFVTLAMLAAGLLAVEIQFATLRPRPVATRLLLGAPDFPSFPSGHAAIAFAWATFLALRFRRRALLALAIAGGIAASRIYVGHHFPSDVLLGAVLGGATSAVAYGCFFADPATRPRWAWWMWAQLALVIFAGVGAYLGLTHFAFLKMPYADKVLHFVLFGALAFFLIAWFPRRRPLLVISAFTAIAILDEAVQAFSPVRSFDMGDLVCTLAGIFLAGYLGKLAVQRSSVYMSKPA